jgi:hypothetical protein
MESKEARGRSASAARFFALLIITFLPNLPQRDLLLRDVRCALARHLL